MNQISIFTFSMQLMITRVLLIDDDKDEHEIFSQALYKYDSRLSCITAVNCSEGFLMAKEQKPDVIFLDMNMPNTNGAICLRKLKTVEFLKNIPIYIYSAATYSEKEKTVFEIGAKDWIKKPGTLEEYKKIFSKYLNSDN
jgi:DNA-binding response OmpR family regulator